MNQSTLSPTHAFRPIETVIDTPAATPDRPAEFLCIGHRGACGHEPENTLRSVRRAIDFGVHGIEIDVQFVRGELLVMHDSKLDRTTNGRGYLARKPLDYLRTLDAGLGERIPTLSEVIETIDRRAFLNIELKGRRTAVPVEALIREFVHQRGWKYADFLVSSFNRRELRALTDPHIPIALLLTRPTRLYALSARRVRASAVNPAARYVTAKFVADAHRRGLRVFPYTANSPAEISRLYEAGVDGMFTDFPERVLAIKQEI